MPFHHHNRTVFALVYELEPTPPAHSSEVIIWLDEHGNAENGDCQPLPPNTRLVTTRPGEYFLLHGKREKVLKVEPYRCHPPIPGGRSSRG